MRPVFLLLFLLTATTGLGQSVQPFRIDSLPPQGVWLNKGWKWQAGDNTEWAKPEFDDSQWAAIDPTKDIMDLPQDIGRVLLNLLNNAFYATQQRKQLSAVSADYQPTVTVCTKRVEAGVEIRIWDNGVGIPDLVKQKIFQPFFTTKPAGQGTGLGLSLSYDIVTKGHGGTLRVESKPEQFTEFIIILPGA